MTKGTLSTSTSSSSIASIARSYAIVSLLQKLITFSLNQVLLRYTNPAVFGKATIQFELFLSSILFVSREGIRLSILRESSSSLDEYGVQRLANLSWLPFVALLFLLFSVLYQQHWLPYIYVSSTSSSLSKEDFNMIVCHNIGALVECISEPWYNIAGLDGLVHVRLYAEALGLISRAIVTFVSMVYYEQGILSFGIAQLAYGIVYSTALIFMSYLARKTLLHGNNEEKHHDSAKNNGTGFISSVSHGQSNNFLPKLLYFPSSWSFSSLWASILDNVGSHSLVLAIAMTGTVVMKHVSTEADKIILSIYASYYNQGIYSVANNYCSLVARLAFFPIEEACRLTFPRMVGEINGILRKMKDQKIDTSNTVDSYRFSDTEESTEIRGKLREMYSLLLALLQLVALVGIVFSLFGPFFARAFVNLILGSRWRSEEIVHTISSFCFYIMIMGLNGVSEAFCQSVVQKRHMYFLTIGLCLSSVVFALSISAFINSMGTAGIVLAIACSMLVRLLFNLSYIYASFQDPMTYLVELSEPTTSQSIPFNSNKNEKAENQAPIRAAPLDEECYFIPMNLIGTIVVIVAILYQSSIITYKQEISTFTWIFTSSLLQKEIAHIGIGILCFLILCVHMYWFKKREIFVLFKRISVARR